MAERPATSAHFDTEIGSTDQAPNQQNTTRASLAQDEVKDSKAGSDESRDNFMSRSKRRISEFSQISQLQSARKSSKHKVTFLRKALSIIAKSTLFKILFLMLRLIPITKIVMYVIYMNQCPAEPFVLTYLLVGGILACVRDFFNVCIQLCLSPECRSNWEVSMTLVAFAYTLAETVWFIVGSVFVYSLHDDYQYKDRTKVNYCNHELYIYAVAVTSLSYALLLLAIIVSCCVMCLAKYADTDH